MIFTQAYLTLIIVSLSKFLLANDLITTTVEQKDYFSSLLSGSLTESLVLDTSSYATSASEALSTAAVVNSFADLVQSTTDTTSQTSSSGTFLSSGSDSGSTTQPTAPSTSASKTSDSAGNDTSTTVGLSSSLTSSSATTFSTVSSDNLGAEIVPSTSMGILVCVIMGFLLN